MRNLNKMWVTALIIVILSSSSLSTVKAASSDEAENTWATKASMSYSEFGMRAIAVNDKIYVMGASNNFEYTPATDSWTNKTSMPTPRTYFAIAAYHDKIYVLGGSSNGDDLGANEVYDPFLILGKP